MFYVLYAFLGAFQSTHKSQSEKCDSTAVFKMAQAILI